MRQVSAFGLFLFSLVGIGFFVMSAPHHHAAPTHSVGSVASAGATVATDTAPLPAPIPGRKMPPDQSTDTRTAVVETTASSTVEAPAPLAQLTVRNGGAAVYPILVSEGTPLIEAMRSLSGSGLVFTSHEFPGLGAFVDSIGTITNGDGSYWILYINGTEASVGASSVHLHQGDSIEWRYERGR